LINTFHSDGNTPLIYAILNKKLEAAFTLLNFNANVNKKSKTGITPLIAALNIIDEDLLQDVVVLLEFLLKNKADVNTSDQEGFFPIMVVAKLEGDHGMAMNVLLSTKPNLEVLRETKTALCIAIDNENYECVYTLIKHGANVNHIYMEDECTRHTFNDIIIFSSFFMLKFAVEHGANINKNIHDKYNGITSPLNACLRDNSPEKLSFLLNLPNIDISYLDHVFNDCVSSRNYDCGRIVLEHLFDKKKQHLIDNCNKYIDLNCVNMIPVSKFAKNWNDEINNIMKIHFEKIINTEEEINIQNYKLCPLCRAKSFKNKIICNNDKCAVCLEESKKMVKYECGHTPCCIACYSFI
jgi:ankyrin repeat protein